MKVPMSYPVLYHTKFLLFYLLIDALIGLPSLDYQIFLINFLSVLYLKLLPKAIQNIYPDNSMTGLWLF